MDVESFFHYRFLDSTKSELEEMENEVKDKRQNVFDK
jgi:hypothetical protein